MIRIAYCVRGGGGWIPVASFILRGEHRNLGDEGMLSHLVGLFFHDITEKGEKNFVGKDQHSYLSNTTTD